MNNADVVIRDLIMKCSAMPHEEARQLVASPAFVPFIGALLLDSIPLWTHPPLETGVGPLG